VSVNGVTADGSNPVSLSFGNLKTNPLPLKKQVQISNFGSSSVTLALAFAANQKVSGATLSVDQSSVTVKAGGSVTVNVTLAGSAPGAGEYSGALTVQGPGVSLRVPYMFLAPAGGSSAFDALAFPGCFEALPGQNAGVAGVRLIDSTGVPLVGTPITFGVSRSGGAGTTLGNPGIQSVGYQPAACTLTTATSATCPTDQYGWAFAEVLLPSQIGANPTITARGGGQSFSFGGVNNGCGGAVIAQPNITSISDPSSGGTSAVAGSYIAISGTALANPANIFAFDGVGDYAFTIPLPLSLDGVTASFDVPKSYDGNPIDYNGQPGAFTFVSIDGGTVLVQVPWEVQAPSNVITVPLVPYAPSIFPNPSDSTIAYGYDNTTQSEVTASNPAHAGDSVELWSNGLGPVNNQPSTGGLPDSSTPATTTTTPTVTVGGQNAKVTYSGLDFNQLFDSPYLVQYGVTIKIPSGLTPGKLPVVLSIGGVTASPVPIPVK
jgi:uncharacterized protein (TIGR03437 family)